jgi:hypothetical protein
MIPAAATPFPGWKGVNGVTATDTRLVRNISFSRAVHVQRQFRIRIFSQLAESRLLSFAPERPTGKI